MLTLKILVLCTRERYVQAVTGPQGCVNNGRKQQTLSAKVLRHIVLTFTNRARRRGERIVSVQQNWALYSSLSLRI